jgi:hypothetical protein
MFTLQAATGTQPAASGTTAPARSGLQRLLVGASAVAAAPRRAVASPAPCRTRAWSTPPMGGEGQLRRGRRPQSPMDLHQPTWPVPYRRPSG